MLVTPSAWQLRVLHTLAPMATLEHIGSTRTLAHPVAAKLWYTVVNHPTPFPTAGINWTPSLRQHAQMVCTRRPPFGSKWRKIEVNSHVWVSPSANICQTHADAQRSLVRVQRQQDCSARTCVRFRSWCQPVPTTRLVRNGHKSCPSEARCDMVTGPHHLDCATS